MFDIGIEVVDKCHSMTNKKMSIDLHLGSTTRTININHLGGNLVH